MNVTAIVEKCIVEHPFQKDASWSRPEWYGDKLMSCETETYDMLYSIARAVKPEKVLETGTYMGFSTSALCTALYFNGTGTIDAVDIEDKNMVPYVLNVQGIGKHKISEADIVTKYTEDVLGFLKRKIDEGVKYNLIYCDDLHETVHLRKELDAFVSLLSKPGYLLVHDSYFKAQGDIGATVKQWAEENGFAHIRFWTARGLDMVYVHG